MAAALIGSAGTPCALGDSRLFALDDGFDTALFLFHSAAADAEVSAPELTLVGTLEGAGHTALADYLFA